MLFLRKKYLRLTGLLTKDTDLLTKDTNLT